MAAASVFGLFLIDTDPQPPGLDPAAAPSRSAYPFLDLAVLSSLIWLLVGNGRPRGALVLVAVSFALTLTADLLRDIGLAAGEATHQRGVARRPAARVAGSHGCGLNRPDGRQDRHTAREKAPSRASTPRLTVLALGVLAVPSLVAVRLWGSEGRVTILLLALAAIIVIILAVWRIKILVSTVEEQRQVTELVLDSAGDGIIGLDARDSSSSPTSRPGACCAAGRAISSVAASTTWRTTSVPTAPRIPWHECPLRELMATGGEGFLTDQVYMRRDGTSFPVEIVISPLIVEGSSWARCSRSATSPSARPWTRSSASSSPSSATSCARP